MLAGYSDSSWANAALLITTPACTEVVAKGNLIDWKSNRSARVCRSTLAAEAIACDDRVDRTIYANAILSELHSGVKAHKDPTGWRLRQLQVTKSLYDAAAENPHTTESEPTWTFAASRSISTIRPFTGCRGPCSGPMDWRNSRRHFDLFFSNGLCDHSSNCQQRITKRKTHQCQHLSIQHMQIHDPSHRQRIVTWLCALKSQVRTSSQ